MAAFTANASISAGTFPRHNRETAHYGTEEDDDIVLVRAIGPYPAGTRLDVFLGGLYTAITHLESVNPTVASFTVGAVIKTSGVFTINAVVKRTAAATGTFTANAFIARGGSVTFSANAVIRPATKSLSADAWLGTAVC